MCGEKEKLLAYEAEHDALLHHHGQGLGHHLHQAGPPPLPPHAAPPPAPPYLSIPPPAGPPPPLQGLPPAYPLAPNICVEGGRIEFIRPALDGAACDDKGRPPPPPPHAAHAPPPIPPHGHRRTGSSAGTVSRAQQTQPLDDDGSEEKSDLAKVRGASMHRGDATRATQGGTLLLTISAAQPGTAARPS